MCSRRAGRTFPVPLNGDVMDHLRKLPLIDGNGEPVDTRIEGVLSRLLPRLRREFPALQDDVVLAEVPMEEAARRIRRAGGTRRPDRADQRVRVGDDPQRGHLAAASGVGASSSPDPRLRCQPPGPVTRCGV